MGFAAKVNISNVDNSIASSLYGTCNTQSNVQVKIVECPDFTNLITGVSIAVKFQYANAVAEPQLNINGTGAVYVRQKQNVALTAVPMSSWQAGTVVTFTYDGTYWMMNTNPLLDLIYPIGSVYLSVNGVNPGTVFGGTWEQIKDRFILSAGDTYAAGSTGGAATVTLTTSNLPSHTHSIPALSGSAASANIAHTHGVGAGNKFVYAPSSTSNTKFVGGGDGRVAPASMDNFSFGTATGSAGGSHTHSVTTNASTTGSNGSGTAVDKMPPYLAVYVWKRTA